LPAHAVGVFDVCSPTFVRGIVRAHKAWIFPEAHARIA